MCYHQELKIVSDKNVKTNIFLKSSLFMYLKVVYFCCTKFIVLKKKKMSPSKIKNEINIAVKTTESLRSVRYLLFIVHCPRENCGERLVRNRKSPARSSSAGNATGAKDPRGNYPAASSECPCEIQTFSPRPPFVPS